VCWYNGAQCCLRHCVGICLELQRLDITRKPLLSASFCTMVFISEESTWMHLPVDYIQVLGVKTMITHFPEIMKPLFVCFYGHSETQ
jgi:hypothetical protein